MFKTALLKKISEFESTNPKEYWELVNQLRSKEKKLSTDQIDGQVWFSFFKKLTNNSNSSNNCFEQGVDYCVSQINQCACNSSQNLDQEISVQEIRKSATQLVNEKASGNDSISNEMIKSGLNILAPILAVVFMIVFCSRDPFLTCGL